MFSFDYHVSENHYLDFNAYVTATNPQIKKSVLLLRLLLPVGLFFILLLPPLLQRDYQSAAVSGVFYALSSVLWFVLIKPLFTVLTRSSVKAQVKKSKSLYTPEGTLSFTDVFMKDVSKSVSTEIGYDKIEKIVVHNACVYFMLSPVSAVLLPAAGFSSEEEMAALFDFIKSKRPDIVIVRE